MQPNPYREQLDKDFSVVRRTDRGNHCPGTRHLHDALDVMLVMEGRLTVTVNGHTFSAEGGDLLLFDPASLHILAPQGGVFDRYVLYFRREFLRVRPEDAARLLECFYIKTGERPGCIRLTPAQQASLAARLDELQAVEAQGEVFGRDLELQYRMGLLLLAINRLYASEEAAGDHRAHNARRIGAVMDYIQQNIDGDLSLKTLAEAHYMDKNRLCALFAETLGTSPRQYVIKARIAAAQQLLLRGESIDRVCGRCGFNSLAHFSRTFKAHTGVCPSHFTRKTMKEGDGET